MGVISVEQTDRLYWLGRYTERVYTTMKLYFRTYDTMIEAGGGLQTVLSGAGDPGYLRFQ